MTISCQDLRSAAATTRSHRRFASRIDATSHLPLSCLLAVALADTVGATPSVPAASDVVDTIAVTATPPSASVTCHRLIRTGFPFAFRAHRVLLNGVLDPAWNRDSSQICRGVIEGLRQVSVSDGVGGTFMGWTDGRGDEPDISLHHVSANGAPVAGWPVGGLRVAELPHSQYPPRPGARRRGWSVSGVGGLPGRSCWRHLCLESYLRRQRRPWLAIGWPPCVWGRGGAVDAPRGLDESRMVRGSPGRIGERVCSKSTWRS